MIYIWTSYFQSIALALLFLCVVVTLFFPQLCLNSSTTSFISASSNSITPALVLLFAERFPLSLKIFFVASYDNWQNY